MKFFKKKFILQILFFLFFSANSYSEIINKVDFKGNERISPETIMIFGDIIIGKDYSETDIGQIIKKLYETKFFSNISIELENNKLIVFVKENPIVDSIFFKGVKADKYKEKIVELLNIREKAPFVNSYVKLDVNQIKSYYRALGYYFVKINAEVEPLKKNKVNIIYTIDRGEKAKISKIYFLGDKKFRDKRLRDVVTSQESKFWKFLSRNVYLNESRILMDKRLLNNFYKNKGYYEVDLTSSNVEYSEGEGFILTYSINAGKRYKFNKIFADISESLDNSAFLTLEPDFNKLVGKYYSRADLNKVLEKIDKVSESKELQFINHRIEETLEGNGVDVKIVIFEGEKFIIEKINIAGNTVTNDSVIRGEMLVDEGDPFSELLVNKSINKIKSRNIFGKVEQKTLPGSSSDLKVLEISVEEKATGEIMAGAGVGSDGASFQFTIKENNWLGKGFSLDTGFNVSKEKITGSLSVVDPNYNFTGNELFASLSVSSTNRSETTGFKSQKSGFNVGTSFEQYEDLYFSPSIEVAFEEITSESDASTSIRKMDGTYLNSDFSYGIALDKRNQPFQTTEGYWLKFNQSLPIIQDTSSIMNNLNLITFHQINDDMVGKIKYHARTIHGVDDHVRLTNRLYIPRNKLRGFVKGRVGPKDGADWVGGNYISGLSAETMLPNLLPEAYKTDFNVFIDAANIWGIDYNESINDSSKIRSTIGIGAVVFTPVGPLSWTASQNITKASTDETESFSFRLGTSF